MYSRTSMELSSPYGIGYIMISCIRNVTTTPRQESVASTSTNTEYQTRKANIIHEFQYCYDHPASSPFHCVRTLLIGRRTYVLLELHFIGEPFREPRRISRISLFGKWWVSEFLCPSEDAGCCRSPAGMCAYFRS